MDIIYAVMGLHNHIKSYLGNEKDIYYMPTDILDNAGNNDGIPII